MKNIGIEVEERIFFSVITPVKNGFNYINRYINSLKSQTYNNWEAIVVVDDSNDDSYEILKLKTHNDKRFKIIRNKEIKMDDCTNTGRNLLMLATEYGSYELVCICLFIHILSICHIYSIKTIIIYQ